jgi:hypothetical protein
MKLNRKIKTGSFNFVSTISRVQTFHQLDCMFKFSLFIFETDLSLFTNYSINLNHFFI